MNQMNNNCTHKIEHSEYKEVTDEFTGESEYKWIFSTESCFVDIDLHRYKCTKCNQVKYYSHAAQQFYEKNIKSQGIMGLE